MSIKGILTWTNPTTNTDGTPFDAATQGGGYNIEFDGTAVVGIPLTAGVTTFDMTTLPAYEALKSGEHNVALAIVTKGGIASAYSMQATFLIDAVPVAPTNLAVA